MMRLRPFRSIPLQRLLVLTAMGQILGTVGLVSYLSFKNGQRTVADLGGQLIGKMNRNVEYELESYLTAPHVVNTLNADAVASGLIDLEDPTLLEYRLWNQFQAFTSVSYVYLSSAQGGLIAVGKDPEGTPLIEVSTQYPEAGPYHVFSADDDGDRGELQQVIPLLDSRTRPWFQRPVAAQKPTWTEPFNFVGREDIVAISASQPLYDAQGTLQGVASVDIDLNHISDFLKQLTDTSTTHIFVMDRKGRLMGTSSDHPTTTLLDGRARILHAKESDNPLISETTYGLESHFEVIANLQARRGLMKIQGEPHFVQVAPWQDEFGLEWLIVVTVPESTFMAQIHANTRMTVLLCLLAVMLSAGLAIVMAQRISAPVLALSNASRTLAEASRQKFATGTLLSGLKAGSIQEIQLLAAAFESMKDQLQSSYSQLEEYSQALELKVKERTQALEQEMGDRRLAAAQLQASERKYRGLHEGSQDAVLLLNRQHIFDCNPAALRMFGCQHKSELCGKTPADFSPPTQPNGEKSTTAIKQTLIKAVRSETYNLEWTHQRTDGQQFPAEVWLTAMTIDDQQVIQGVVRDITLRKQAESDLLKAKEAAEIANRAKSRFLANMSHELRSPLNAILGFSRLMAESATLPAEHRDNIDIVSRSGQHLLSLINDVLDMSKIEAGQATLTLAPFALNSLLADVRDMFQLLADQKHLLFNIDKAPGLPLYFCGDQGKLKQILINLLSNAIKFTHTGRVTLSVAMLPPDSVGLSSELATESAILHFEITDTGIGIADHEISQVLKPFVQSQSGRSAAKGTGLGLSISHQFVQLMGGQMTITSRVSSDVKQSAIEEPELEEPELEEPELEEPELEEPELEQQSGTSVCFNVPVSIVYRPSLQPANVHQQVLGLAETTPNHRILIVDDHEDNRQLLIRLLAPLGLLLKEAKNGQEAVEIASAWQPHLIWMDLRMPVMDGYRATRQIKAAALNAVGSQSVALPADNSTAHFPIIIALSANSLPEEKAAALDCGCDDFIRKPFNTERIFDVMKQQLNLRYQYGELGSSKPGKLVQEASEQGELALTGEPDFTTELFEENNQPALSALSPSQLTALESATLRLEWDQILQIVEEIKVEHVALAETLTLMVHQFRYGQILESIQAARLQSSPVEASPVEASPVAEHLSR